MIKKLCWSLALGQSLLWISPLLVFVPLPAAAYTAEDLLTVYWLAGEDYTALARRAETVARTAAQQGFDTDILLTRVVITVLGQNGGQTAPILKMDVGRNDWRNRPDPRYWSSYYRSAPTLLGLEGVAPTGTVQTTPTAPAPVTPVPLPPANRPANGNETSPGAGSGSTPGNPPSNAGNVPSNTPSNNSTTRRSPGRSTNRPAPSQSGSPTSGAANDTTYSVPNTAGEQSLPTGSDSGSSSGNPPAINLPAVPAGVGIPSSILQ